MHVCILCRGFLTEISEQDVHMIVGSKHTLVLEDDAEHKDDCWQGGMREPSREVSLVMGC